jgi:Family of unknown function (DUF5990)
MADEITLRIVLETPPPGVDFGIQKGRGSIFETIERQRSTGGDVVFEFSVGLKAASAGGQPDFAGDIVQGPRGGRFVYVDIGTYAGQRDTPWSRRLKIPLSGINAELMRRAVSKGAVLEARVPGTGRDGGPSCASAKDFDGWTLAK